MILVDTSVWIDLFGKKPRLSVPIEKLPLLATCPPVIQEVLQGIREERALVKIRAGFLALSCIGNPLDLECYLEAAELYRAGRRRGLTIRSSVDCLISALAIRYHMPVWHYDRDFDALARYCGVITLQHL